MQDLIFVDPSSVGELPPENKIKSESFPVLEEDASVNPLFSINSTAPPSHKSHKRSLLNVFMVPARLTRAYFNKDQRSSTKISTSDYNHFGSNVLPSTAIQIDESFATADTYVISSLKIIFIIICSSNETLAKELTLNEFEIEEDYLEIVLQVYIAI